ncbi:PaaI family thioesterase [Paenibacillus lemnae]|uniref:PaaI family thioesterase n=1 Tax=Paenibacillus lemnae TaxID=1330551 RepID=A0A848MA27_PAELE|nr:PaaI family thioesterase [Paenibacillus lemnae]NMO97109.1 PaaI family thioesterase [Paenibacillus lemnae]
MLEGDGQESESHTAYLQGMTRAAAATFWGYLGCELESADNKAVIVTLEAQPHHLNLMGIVHGGVLSSLMDNAMGIVVMLKHPEESVVTSNLNVHFVMPAKQGKLRVTAHIVHEARRSVTAESRITDAEGQMVALSTGSFRVIGGNSGVVHQTSDQA